MAEGFFKSFCSRSNDITVCSRGIAAVEGASASRFSVQASAELGSDISSHISRQLTESDVRGSDFIFTMTASHAAVIRATFPDCADKVYSIGEYISSDDIADPYGGDICVYRSCAEQIFEAVKKIYHKITVQSNESSF